jgi:hypothetical protein
MSSSSDFFCSSLSGGVDGVQLARLTTPKARRSATFAENLMKVDSRKKIRF